MVWTIKTRRAWGSGVAGVVLGIGGVAAIAGSGFAAAAQGASSAMLALQALAISAAGAAWIKGRNAHLVAEKASADLDALAGHLIRVEQHLIRTRTSAEAPALRSSMDEVAGELGLLGGIVRDLAEAVAAQDRDVAELRAQVERPAPPRFGSAPLREPVRQVQPPMPMHPEPSLLPMNRREAAVPDAEAGRATAIVRAFEADRIELHLQPIVSLPQRKVRFYEAFARLRLEDDTVLMPAEFLPLLERLGHAAELDRRVVGRAISIARHLMNRGSEAIVSVNLSPNAVADTTFLRSLGRIVDANPDAVGRLVLELSQRCWRTLDAERAGVLAALRDKGVPFALDRASDLRIDPLALADRGVRFVKLAADLIVSGQRAGAMDIEIGDLAAVLRRAGIKLVAERVEREDIVPDLIDLDVPLGQGFVFSAPRAVRSEVLAPSVANETSLGEPQAPAAAPEAPSAAEERQPFRAFLRRAG